MAPNLTPAERRVIYSYLNLVKPGRALVYRLIQTVPTMVFAAYALWRQDFAAALASYLTLLIVNALTWTVASRELPLLLSALRKYEDVVGAFRTPAVGGTQPVAAMATSVTTESGRTP